METSLGTTFWEPIAKTLAEINGFTIIQEEILVPNPFPQILQHELDKLVDEREKKPNKNTILTQECIQRLKNAALKTNPENITQYVSPPKGTGVDIHLFKDGVNYLFDIKTAQPNLGDFKKFNKQMLEWFAYSFAKNPNTDLEAAIAIPFNPFTKSWYEEQKSKLSSSPLDISQDIWVENEFWDFGSGSENTFEELKSLFVELGQEDFAGEFHDIFYPK